MTKTIAFFGKKQSGKGSCATLLAALNLVSYNIIDNFNVLREHRLLINESSIHVNNIQPRVVKIYNFADALKFWCRDVFSVDESLLFGTDEQKNQHTHLRWEDMPGIIANQKLFNSLQKTFKKNNELYSHGLDFSLSYHKPGFITGRELLQYFGSDICRKIYKDCWTDYLFKQIKQERPLFAIIADGRFDNEVSACHNNNAFSIKLTRDKYCGADSHSSENGLSDNIIFNLIIDNKKLTLEQTFKELIDKIRPTNIMAPIRDFN